MNSQFDFAKYINSYNDFPKPGILFRDIFPLIAEVSAFREAIDQLYLRTNHLNIDKILSIEARGFIIGAALSLKYNKSMIPARKFGKLPGETISYTYNLEYGKDSMQVPKNSIKKGDRILIADDVLATGGTCAAAIELTKLAGGDPVALCSLIELSYLGGRKLLESKNLQVISLISYKD